MARYPKKQQSKGFVYENELLYISRYV